MGHSPKMQVNEGAINVASPNDGGFCSTAEPKLLARRLLHGPNQGRIYPFLEIYLGIEHGPDRLGDSHAVAIALLGDITTLPAT